MVLLKPHLSTHRKTYMMVTGQTLFNTLKAMYDKVPTQKPIYE